MQLTKRISHVVILSLFSVSAMTFVHAESWSLSPQSKIGFNIKSMGVSVVSGQFSKFKSSMVFDAKNPQKMTSNFEMDVTSLVLSKPSLKSMIMGEDLFYVDKYKNIVFKSTEFKSLGNQKYDVKGNLTIRGITKPVVFSTLLKPNSSNAKLMDVEASTVINRSDFGMKKAFAGVGEKVDIQLSGQWKAQ